MRRFLALSTCGLVMLAPETVVVPTPHLLASAPAFTSIDVPGGVRTGGPNSWLGTDARGDIVGAYRTLETAGTKTHGFLLRNDEYVSFDHPGSTGQTFANGINPEGDIAGAYFAGLFAHSYLLTKGSFASFDPPGALFSFALVVNARGQIVGAYNSASTNIFTGTRGYLLTEGEFTTITVPGTVYTWAAGINSQVTIVGRYQSSDGTVHGYVLHHDVLAPIDFPRSLYTD